LSPNECFSYGEEEGISKSAGLKKTLTFTNFLSSLGEDYGEVRKVKVNYNNRHCKKSTQIILI
jgi:hypothetical protein